MTQTFSHTEIFFAQIRFSIYRFFNKWIFLFTKAFIFFLLDIFFHKVFDVHRFYPVIFLNLFFWLIFSYLFQIILFFICFYIYTECGKNCISKLCIHISVTQKFLHTDAQKPFIKKSVRAQTLLCKTFAHTNVKLTEAPGSFIPRRVSYTKLVTHQCFWGRNPLFL